MPHFQFHCHFRHSKLLGNKLSWIYQLFVALMYVWTNLDDNVCVVAVSDDVFTSDLLKTARAVLHQVTAVITVLSHRT